MPKNSDETTQSVFDTTKLIFVTDEQLLRKVIREEIAGSKKEPIQANDLSDKMDRRKAAKFLSVSYQTMYNWTKEGIIKEHGQGRKKYYLRQELIESMQNNG
ncbi:MAG: helix-turn-helix domain-containing protein [Mariniphaga sp.]